MTLTESVDLVLKAFECGKNGDVFVQKSPAATVKVIKDAILQLIDKPKYNVSNIGIRHGEKLHETLLSQFELEKAIDLGKYFQIPSDPRNLNYAEYVESGNTKSPMNILGEGYTSKNTDQLDTESMKKVLMNLECIKKLI